MKKTHLLTITLISILIIKAQDHQPLLRFDHESEFIYNEAWLQKLNSEGKKIKEITCSSSKHPNDLDYTLLNSIGQITERKFTNRWGMGFMMFKDHIHRKNEYENGELVKVEYYNKKGELDSRYLNEYTMIHKIKHTQSFRKEKKYRETFTDYNTDSTQKEYRSYNVKNEKTKLTLKYEYDYYPDKQKKETRQYNRKNQLKYTWKYDCNPKGEVVKKETQVCKNSGMNNKGYIVDVIFNTNAKGKKTKNIHTYYMFNGRKIHVAHENYLIKDGKEIKLNDVHYADSLEPYYCSKTYDKKGRVSSERKQEFTTYLYNKQVLKRSSFILYTKGKMDTHWESSYTENGLPLLSQVFDKKNKTLGRAVYTYEGDKSYSISHYNKKQKLTEVYSGKVTYY